MFENYVYDGEFFEGKKQGKGKFQWADGSSYDGDFIDDRLEGKGKGVFLSLLLKINL